MTASTIEGEKKTRNNTVQIFRALAIIAVVMIHTTPGGAYQVVCRPFINFSVATFIFLSGYLTKIDNESWIAFLKKRIVRVLVPYIIWTVLYTLAFQHIDRLPINLLTAKASCQMYYILVYIQFVLLTPLLGRLATSRYQFLGWFIAPISVITFKYYWLLTDQELESHISVIWSVACLGWFTFYYLGLLLGNQIIERNYSFKTLVLLYIFSIVLQIAEGYVWLILGESNCGTQLKLTSFLTSSLFLLLVYVILKSCHFDIKNRFLRMVGDYSFGIYLCHMMVINILSTFIPEYNSVPYPVTSFIVVLLSFFCCYIGNRACGDKICKWIGLK